MSTLLREAVRRRVPHVLGIYLAGAWGVLEFSSWLDTRFDLPADPTLPLIVLLALGLPATALAAWRLGAGGGEAGIRPADPPRADPFEPDRPTPSDRSVAVLPFANLSGRTEDEYLSDGIAEEIIDVLASVSGLRVAARTSSFVWRDRDADVRQVGRSLGVSTVLEGGVQRSGERIRVTTRLLDAEGGWTIWSARFDRRMDDLLAIEDEIAGAVAGALRVVLEGDRRELAAGGPSDIRAYEYVLRGRRFFHQTRKTSLELAIQMFRKAAEIDPEYAAAWVGMAEAAALTAMYFPTRTDCLRIADEAAAEAMRLAPERAEAHAALGMARFVAGRLDEAEAAFREAIRRDPRLFDAWYFRARAHFQQGRLQEAAEGYERAAAIRPDCAASFFAAQAWEALGEAEIATRRYREALAVIEEHMELNPDDPRAATMRAVANVRVGRPEEGLRWAERALELDPADPGVRYNAACLFALQGRVERALDHLEGAFAAGFGNWEWIRQDPDLEGLRSEPRFEALLAEAEPGAASGSAPAGGPEGGDGGAPGP